MFCMKSGSPYHNLRCIETWFEVSQLWNRHWLLCSGRLLLFKELWQLVSGQTKFKELWQPYFNLLLGGQSRQGGRIGGASEEGGVQSKYDFCKRHYLFTNICLQMLTSRWKFMKKSWRTSKSNTSLVWTHWREGREKGFEEYIAIIVNPNYTKLPCNKTV